MSNSIDDKLLHDYLRGDSEFSQRYKSIESDEVPTDLDTLVIAQATQNLVAKKPSPSSNWRKWSAPLAVAATIIVTVSIVIQSNVDSPPVHTQLKLDQPERYASEARSEKDAAEPQPSATSDLAPSEKRSADTKLKQTEAERSNAGAMAPPAVEQTREFKSNQARKEELDNVVVTGQHVSGSVEDAAMPVTVFSAEDLASLPDRSKSVRLERGVLDLKPIDKSYSANDARQRSASMPPAAPAAMAPAAQAKSSTKAGSSELEEVVVTAASRRGNAYDSAMPVELIRAREANPEAWLKYIRDLRFDGQIISAGNEWKRFKEAYPDFPVADNDSARMK